MGHRSGRTCELYTAIAADLTDKEAQVKSKEFRKHRH